MLQKGRLGRQDLNVGTGDLRLRDRMAMLSMMSFAAHPFFRPAVATVYTENIRLGPCQLVLYARIHRD